MANDDVLKQASITTDFSVYCIIFGVRLFFVNLAAVRMVVFSRLKVGM